MRAGRFCNIREMCYYGGMAKLSDKQKVWVEFYLQTWNATDAARKAGYKGSYGTLRAIGSENLTKPNIKAEISNRLSETVMESNEVLSRLASMARGFDIVDYAELKEVYQINKKGKEFLSGYALWFDLEKLKKDGFSHLVKKLKQTTGGIEFESQDQMAALVHVGKNHQLFTDNLDITSKGKRLFKVSIDD